MVSLSRPDLICLQETKLVDISSSTVRSLLRSAYENNFFLPATGTRGGILLAAHEDNLTLQHPHVTTNTISASVLDVVHNASWMVTVVYGPQGELEKIMFIRELKEIKQAAKPQWLVLGDFNLIYKDQDKSNCRINDRLMLRFRRALNFMEVKEVELVGKQFTWSNNQQTPTMSCIDRVFCTPAWEDLYSNPILQPQSSSSSDHCPLLLMPLCPPRVKPMFRFEAFWADMSGFSDCVLEAWSREVPVVHNPLGVFHIKLSRTAKALQAWSRSLFPLGKVALVVCREVVQQLDKAQESRPLSTGERESYIST
jgi:exonuclease III